MIWGLLLVLGVGGVVAAGCTAQQARADVKETTMSEVTVQVSTVPRLDAAVPATLETATFALG